MKKSLFFGLAALFVALMFVMTLTPPASAGRSSRDLVFEEDETEQAPDQSADTGEGIVAAVKAAVELTRDGQTDLVLPSFEFQSGDKIKLVYMTNVDCYVYWLSQGSSGDHYMLFPNEKVGMDNWVTKNTEYKIPVKGSFKFDENKGVEKILMVMAHEKIPELEEAAKTASIKGGKVKEIQDDQESKRQSRDLVFEEEEDEDTGVSTRSQKSNDISEPFVVDFVLVHN